MVQYGNAYECLICGFYFTEKAKVSVKTATPSNRPSGMRYVSSESIQDLRAFPTVEALLVGARQVATRLRMEPGQPKFFLAVLEGDGGFRGVFFADDRYHREIVGEVADEAGVQVLKVIAEGELLK